MPYSFQPDAMYRMPTHFGPRTGPRRGPDGRGFDCVNSPKSLSHSVSFLTHACRRGSAVAAQFRSERRACSDDQRNLHEGNRLAGRTGV